jgi:EAL and modified HD-GYP domain-containing signal transduction protein
LDPVLPPERCVIEILEDVSADPETLCAVRRLTQAGYRFALDDVICRPSMVAEIRPS